MPLMRASGEREKGGGQAKGLASEGRARVGVSGYGGGCEGGSGRATRCVTVYVSGGGVQRG